MLCRIVKCVIITIAVLTAVPGGCADVAGAEDSDAALLTLIKAYNNKLNLQFSADVRVVTELYKRLNGMLSLPVASPQALNTTDMKEANKLKHQMRTYIVHENGGMLASLLDGRYPYSKDYADFIAGLIADFDAPVMSAIFARAVDVNFFFKPGEELADFLWKSNKQHLTTDKTTLAVTLDQQLQLFWKIRQNGFDNDSYTFKVSYYFNQVKKDPLYPELDAPMRWRLDAAIRALPLTMQNFYFKPYFCLLNKRYKENIYTALHMWDSDRRKIYSWKDATWVEDAGFWQHDVKEQYYGTDAALNLKFLIRSDKFKKYLYMDRNIPEHNNVIAVWESGQAPSGSAWSVEFMDNYLTFSQDGYLMCNSDRFFDSTRRYPYGFRDRYHTKNSDECQWIVDQCERYK